MFAQLAQDNDGYLHVDCLNLRKMAAVLNDASRILALHSFAVQEPPLFLHGKARQMLH